MHVLLEIWTESVLTRFLRACLNSLQKQKIGYPLLGTEVTWLLFLYNLVLSKHPQGMIKLTSPFPQQSSHWLSLPVTQRYAHWREVLSPCVTERGPGLHYSHNWWRWKARLWELPCPTWNLNVVQGLSPAQTLAGYLTTWKAMIITYLSNNNNNNNNNN